MPKTQRRPKERSSSIRLTSDDVLRLSRLRSKYPEMNDTAILRRALRELAEKEQVA